MAFVGMIIEEVEQLAAQLQQRAQEIEETIASLTSALAATTWKGPDHELFQETWHSSHVPALRNVMNGLLDAHNNAMANARQQREASAS